MIDVATLNAIRLRTLREHLSILEIASRTELSRNTIRNFLRSDVLHSECLLPSSAPSPASCLTVHRSQPTGWHEFDQLCQALGTEHRLTKPKTPQTNGMVERVSSNAEDLEKALHRFVWLYNHHLPQKAVRHEAPVQALKDWKMKSPDLLAKNGRNHPGPDSYLEEFRIEAVKKFWNTATAWRMSHTD